MQVEKQETYNGHWVPGYKYIVMSTGETYEEMEELRLKIDEIANNLCIICFEGTRIHGHLCYSGWKEYIRYYKPQILYFTYRDDNLAALEYAFNELGIEIEIGPKV